MSIDKILLILLLVAVIALVAYLILGPIISDVRDGISQKTDLGDVAVTAAGEYLAMQMTQAAATPTIGTPPPSAAEIAATALAAEQRFQATQEAAVRLEKQHLQATQEAKAEEERLRTTATAEYWRIEAWQATQTQAWVLAATAAPATQVALSWTQTAIPEIATADASVRNAQQTVVAGQAMQVEMSVQRQRWAGVGNTLVLWTVMLAALLITGYFVWQMKRVRKLTPDGRVHLLDNGKAGQQIVASDLMPAPVITVSQTGQVAAAGSGADQSQVTERAQKVRALEAVARANQPPRQPFDLVNDIMTGQASRYALSEPPSDLVSNNALQALNADWKENS